MKEIELVYGIIETLNAYEYNNDNNLNERFVRNLLNSYRGEILRKQYSSQGSTVTDECFQRLTIEMKPVFNKYREEFFTLDLPGIIELDDRTGFYVEKNGIVIPIARTMDYNNRTEEGPIGKKIGTSMYITLDSSLDSCITEGSNRRILFDMFSDEIRNRKIVVDLYAILVNPSDDPNYDWTKDIYPFPAEKIDELKTTIMRKEFGITANIKSDETPNMRTDNIRYHENTNLEQ